MITTALRTYTVSTAGLVYENAMEDFLFPGGDAHIAIDKMDEDDMALTQIAYIRGADPNSLMCLAMWADACRRSHQYRDSDLILFLPYLPGARQDRGNPLGAKVYADFLNQLDLSEIVCIDPHSDVMPALVDNLTVVPINHLPITWPNLKSHDKLWRGVIAPDLGARKRAEAIADHLQVPVYQAMKHRDFATGKLSGFTCEEISHYESPGQYLVVDDICDGGGTFKGLAQATGVARENLSLWVTHGIFSEGAQTLHEYYSHIGTTDSHPGHNNDRVPPSVRSVEPMFPFLVKKILGIDHHVV